MYNTSLFDIGCWIFDIHTGVLVQNNVEIKGGTVWIGTPVYKKHNDKEPLVLQDHGNDGGNPMSYRNIWVREL